MGSEHTDSSVPYRTTPLETASGMVFGIRSDVDPLPMVSPDFTPRQALEDAVLPALSRSPCVVSFSGGLDSSVVLAVAVAVARRNDLPPPIPVTLRFPHARMSDESVWQEAVVRHLGLSDWEKIEISDELDVIGPYAMHALRRHGQLWPFNAHFHMPIFEQAAGGAALTGAGGDELLCPGRWARIGSVLARRVRPKPRDVLRLAMAFAPRHVRAVTLWLRERSTIDTPWLRPAARRALARIRFLEAAREPVRFDASVRLSWWPSRYRWAIETALAVLSADVDVMAVHPLEDPVFLAAVAKRGGAAGYRTRADAAEDLFGDLLPTALVGRRSKARFDDVFWGPYSRAFACNWNGEGVDPTLVDVDVIRSIWMQKQPQHLLTWSLLQAAWLATQCQQSSTESLD